MIIAPNSYAYNDMNIWIIKNVKILFLNSQSLSIYVNYYT